MSLRTLAIPLAASWLFTSGALAQPVYGVMSLAGDQLAIHAVRPEVGTRAGSASAHMLPMAEQAWTKRSCCRLTLRSSARAPRRC